jgi:hypothetical protein
MWTMLRFTCSYKDVILTFSPVNVCYSMMNEWAWDPGMLYVLCKVAVIWMGLFLQRPCSIEWASYSWRDMLAVSQMAHSSLLLTGAEYLLLSICGGFCDVAVSQGTVWLSTVRIVHASAGYTSLLHFSTSPTICKIVPRLIRNRVQ